jgi:hypothetical protein
MSAKLDRTQRGVAGSRAWRREVDNLSNDELVIAARGVTGVDKAVNAAKSARLRHVVGGSPFRRPSAA